VMLVKYGSAFHWFYAVCSADTTPVSISTSSATILAITAKIMPRCVNI
jgi:hypothetical protein